MFDYIIYCLLIIYKLNYMSEKFSSGTKTPKQT